jgi:hypothetical protein
MTMPRHLLLLAVCCQMYLILCAGSRPPLASARALLQQTPLPSAATAAPGTAPDAGLLATTAGCAMLPPSPPSPRAGASAGVEAGGGSAHAVLLRVSPWAGCGVQVTFGLGWGEVLNPDP